MEVKSFGRLFKELRLRNGYTLRGFCQASKKDPGNISKMERGILPPPQDRGQLETYAAAFKLKPGTDEYDLFFELAAVSSGRIPESVLSDEELLGRLPVFFRTISGQKIDPSKLDTFIELLKRS